MIGWAIFRSENTAHIGPFLAALFGKSQTIGRAGGAAGGAAGAGDRAL